MSTIYDYKAADSHGEEIDLSQYRGKALLIVNTASKCGFTPQFGGLEELYQKYQSRGLMILGFPSGDFANQEMSDGSKAANFCQLNYGVTFPIMEKVHVNGDDAHPVFKYLKSVTRGFFGRRIKWNFTKFLISPDGTKIKRYGPTTSPASIAKDIEQILG